MTEEQFHADRRTGIGGSDAAAIMGVSPWAGPMDVWMDKMGLREPEPPSLRMWVGQRLEPLIGEMFTARTGIKVRRVNTMLRSPRYPWMVGHVDFRGLEVKTARSAHGWGEDGSVVTPDDDTAVPMHYLFQVQHYLVVTRWPKMHVAVLIGHDDFRTYEVEPIPAMQRDLIDAEQSFWHDYVVTETPPPLDGSPASRRYVATKYPVDTDPERPATPDEDRMVRSLLEVRGDLAELERVKDAIEVKVKDAIGDARGIFGPGGKVTWVTVRRKPATDWQAVANAYRKVIDDFRFGNLGQTEVVAQLLAVDLDTLRELHTSIPDAYRRLSITAPTQEDTDA